MKKNLYEELYGSVNDDEEMETYQENPIKNRKKHFKSSYSHPHASAHEVMVMNHVHLMKLLM